VFIATAWYTGMRRNEMLDLTWDDRGMPTVDLANNRIRIPAAYNKSDEDQWLPLHPQLTEILGATAERRGYLFPTLRRSPTETSRKFSKLARSLGLRITLHDLRRSFGSRYASVVQAPVLQRLMRHADIKTTLTYYTDIDDQLDEAIRKA
jgi:integrase